MLSQTANATVDVCAINELTGQCISGDESNYPYIGIGWKFYGDKCLEVEAICKQKNYNMTRHPYRIEIYIAALLLIIFIALFRFRKRRR